MQVNEQPIRSYDTCDGDRTIRHALIILEHRLSGNAGEVISSPSDTRTYLKLKMAELECEVFAVLMLNTRHGVIEYREIFRGTIDGSSVHPREVVKAALACNAAAVILAHNHPSMNVEPSRADITLTRRLNDALALVDVRVLDHIVIGGIETTSFAERGLI